MARLRHEARGNDRRCVEDPVRHRKSDATAKGIALKALVAALVRRSGVEVLVRRTISRDKVGILVYHDPSPEQLEAHLEFLSKRYRFVTMTDLSTALATGDWSEIPRNALAVTFDDGHHGNRELVTLLERFGVRPTIYLCSGVVRGDGLFWFRLPGVDPEPLKLMSPAERTIALQATGLPPELDRHALTPSEVRAMAPAVDFGSHTLSHPVLPLCTDATAAEEITASRIDVEEISGLPCSHLSYPNGDYTEREIGFARAAGYASARTTEIGWNGRAADPLRLRIVSLADFASVDVLAAHLAGLLAVRRLVPSVLRRRALRTRIASAQADATAPLERES